MGSRVLPRVLLLQVRDHLGALEHEQRCFQRVCGERADLDFRNLMAEPELRWSDLDSFDVLMVGGSGECSVTREYPFTAPLRAVVREWVERSQPLWGSCWGHQFLADALGGSVATDPKSSEIGTFTVDVNAVGRRDRVFEILPVPFRAQMGHHDAVLELPPGAEALAHSERCPNQVIRLSGKPIYSTQFHSEMGRRQMLERLDMYRASYLHGQSLEEMAARLESSPAVHPLVGRFLDVYL